MNYEKPEIVLIASAVETIKGGKGSNDLETFQATEAAYEADE